MPTHAQDVEALLAEVQADPTQAEAVIQALSERNAQLQVQSDELRAENILLKRTGAQQIYAAQLEALRGEHLDLVNLATRKQLNPQLCTLISSDGHALCFDPPAPFEQTLPIEGLDEDAFVAHRPAWLLGGRKFDTNLYFTSSYRALRRKVSAYNTASNLAWAQAQTQDARSLKKAERIEAALCVDELHPPKQIVLASKLGWVRALSWDAFLSILYSGQSYATNNTQDDTPLTALPCTAGDCLLATRSGKWLRFPLAAIEPGGGNCILMLMEDSVAAACVIEPDTEIIHAIGADGACLSFVASAFAAHKKPLGKPTNFPRGFRPFGLLAAGRDATLLTLANDATLEVLNLRRNPIAKSMGEAQPLNVLNKRLCAYMRLA